MKMPLFAHCFPDRTRAPRPVAPLGLAFAGLRAKVFVQLTKVELDVVELQFHEVVPQELAPHSKELTHVAKEHILNMRTRRCNPEI